MRNLFLKYNLLGCLLTLVVIVSTQGMLLLDFDNLPQRPSQRGCIGWKRRQIPKWLYDNNRMWFGQNIRREQEGQYCSNRIWPWGQTSCYWSYPSLTELHIDPLLYYQLAMESLTEFFRNVIFVFIGNYPQLSILSILNINVVWKKKLVEV